MFALERLAEQRIAEAQAHGDFDDLPGAGEPLPAEDNAFVPQELRAAYRVLKNAGYLPPQAAHFGELHHAEQLLAAAPDVRAAACNVCAVLWRIKNRCW